MEEVGGVCKGVEGYVMEMERLQGTDKSGEKLGSKMKCKEKAAPSVSSDGRRLSPTTPRALSISPTYLAPTSLRIIGWSWIEERD